MGRRSYGGYRGRVAARDVFRLVLALLALLLVLAAAGLMIGQRYIVYTDDGIRLELPFFRREGPSGTDAPVTVDIVPPVRPSGQEDQSKNLSDLSIEG